MTVKVTAETKEGGAVILNKKRHVWASYAVASVGDMPPSDIMCAGATLPDGRAVQFFLNRETNLIVVDVIDAKGKGGNEIFRRKV